MMRRHMLACGGMRWHANECQLATLNSQPSTLIFQQSGGGAGGKLRAAGLWKSGKPCGKQAGRPAMKEETRMMFENKSAAHAVSGSTGGRVEQVCKA